MNITKSSLKIFAANVVAAGTNFLGVVIFSRLLGASVIGTYFLFVAVLGILAIPADFGLRGAVEKRISEGKETGSFNTAALLLKLLPILLISILIFFFRGHLNDYLGSKLALLLIVVLIVREFAQLSVFILRGELRVGETAILKVVRQVVWLGVSIVLVWMGLGISGLMYGYLLGFGIVFVWGWYKVSIPANRPALAHVRSLLEYGRYNVISHAGGYFYNWMDILIIGFFLTTSDVGAYEVAWRVTMVVTLFSQAIATTIFPQVSRWDAEDAKTRIVDLIPSAVSPSLLLVIPAFFGTLVLSKDILRTVFGPEFTIAWLVLIVLMGEKILQGVHVILGRSLQAIDRPDLAAWATVVAVLINLVLNVILIWQFGIIGAAVATTVSFTVNTVLHGYFLARHVDVNLPYAEIGWSVVSATGMALVVYTIRSILVVDDVLRLIGLVAIGGIVYSLLILTFSPLRSKIQKQLRLITRTLSGRFPY